MTNVTEQVTYGNLSRPGRTGLGALSMGASLAGIPVVLLCILLMIRQAYLAALIVAVVGVGAIVATSIRSPRDGRNVYERAMLHVANAQKVSSGRAVYMAGPAGTTPDGKIRVPGLLAQSELSEHRDAFGQPFGLIRLRSSKHYTVVLECYPDGDALVDQDRVDSMVAHWGGWLATLTRDVAIVGASVTVESAPDSGFRLEQMVNANMSPKGSEFSRAVARALPNQVSAGSPTVTTRVAVTFSGRGFDKDGTDKGLEAMVDEISTRLPTLISGLHQTGAGTSVRACTAQDIVDFTRTAYDPTVANQIERARADGGTGLTWHDAGPVYADDRKLDRYFHDRAVSKSWTMHEAPRGVFYASALRSLLDPSPGVLRKRVTLLYRPIPAGQAADVVEGAVNNSYAAASQRNRPTARQQQRYAQAVRTAEEEALGAGLVRFGMIVTVSCAEESELPRLDQAIPSMAAQGRLRIREALGNQAVYFQAALPLGVVLPEHTIIPDQVRGLM